MAKEVNVVYPAHQGKRVVHYKGPEGTVWLSSKQDRSMPNVFTSWYACPNPRPDDSLIMLEPVVVHQQDYKIEYLNKFKKVFGCFNKAFVNTDIADKYVKVNYGSILAYEDPDALKKRWMSWKDRKNGMLVVSSSKTSNHKCSIYMLREQLADLFHAEGFEVAWYGGIPGKKRKKYFKGRLEDKIGEICKYRFHICPENTYDEKFSYNYFTEKLPHAIYGGAVPLYMGCYNVEQFAPENTFFDLRKYITKEPNARVNIDRSGLLKAIREYSEMDFETYQKAAYDYLKDPKGLMFQTDMRRYYKKMLEVL